MAGVVRTPAKGPRPRATMGADREVAWNRFVVLLVGAVAAPIGVLESRRRKVRDATLRSTRMAALDPRALEPG